MASRKTHRANSSGFTVVLPIDLSVSHASSKAVSKTTSICGLKELLWNPRMAPSSIIREAFGDLPTIGPKWLRRPACCDQISHFWHSCGAIWLCGGVLKERVNLWRLFQPLPPSGKRDSTQRAARIERLERAIRASDRARLIEGRAVEIEDQ
jgi:hypothetical protein